MALKLSSSTVISIPELDDAESSVLPVGQMAARLELATTFEEGIKATFKVAVLSQPTLLVKRTDCEPAPVKVRPFHE